MRKTMGIVVVAALAANTTTAPPVVTITATCRRIKGAASKEVAALQAR
jgi:hypothetical protein